ncbi:hypothetical protein YC2023_104591 [Brassica napus]
MHDQVKRVRWFLKTNKAANTKSKELSAESSERGSLASNNSFLISSLNAPSKLSRPKQRSQCLRNGEEILKKNVGMYDMTVFKEEQSIPPLFSCLCKDE